ncbi:MAG: TylF/MycF/NovP-related O-methyltransferase [Armatimonadota bacterium]
MADAWAQEASFLKSALRSALHLAERTMPQCVFRPLFAGAFGAYRLFQRLLFLRFPLRYLITGDSDRQLRSWLVFRAMPYSLVGWKGLAVTYDAVNNVLRNGIQGALVECGVARGGSSALMALTCVALRQRRKLWLFDSFEGLPDPTIEDFLPGTNATGAHIRPLPRGSCLGTIEQVQDLFFRKFRIDPRDVTMVKGWFQDTLPSNRNRIGDIAVLRIDADWYESTKCCLENLYDSVVPGGYVIIDDYCSCYGAKKATDEFLNSRKQNVDIQLDGRGGAFFVRPAE